MGTVVRGEIACTLVNREGQDLRKQIRSKESLEEFRMIDEGVGFKNISMDQWMNGQS